MSVCILPLFPGSLIKSCCYPLLERSSHAKRSGQPRKNWIKKSYIPVWDNVHSPNGENMKMAALFRPKSLNLTALAHDLIVENLRDGIIILDDKDHVVEINSAAQGFLGVADQEAVGMSAAELLERFPDLLEQLEDESPAQAEISIKTPAERLYFDMTVLPAIDKSGVQLGRVITLRDATERVKLHAEVERLATTDPLTGVLNRKHFFQAGELEVKRSIRYARPLALLLLDIDFFKKVNDTYGHAVGDKVLKKMAASLCDKLRQSDIVGRYGGEEFVVLLPETEKSAALNIAERLRLWTSKMSIHAEDATFNITTSIGVAALGVVESKTLADLLNAADAALSRAKGNGRNRVEE
jgi:diguanylate cyclase (GGDEF)-like protein/PAS domain S-box-containing protein